MVFGLPSILYIANGSLDSSYAGNPADLGEILTWMEGVAEEPLSPVPVTVSEPSPIPRTPSQRIELPSFVAYLCAFYTIVYFAISFVREGINVGRWLRS